MASEMCKQTMMWDKTCFNCEYGSHSSKIPACVKCFAEDRPGNRWPEWRPYNGPKPE